MKYFDWSIEKNAKLKKNRDISFEEIIEAIFQQTVIITVDHTNRQKYPNQRIFIVNYNEYIYLVPFVEDEEKIFLKTIIPSRKANKKYHL